MHAVKLFVFIFHYSRELSIQFYSFFFHIKENPLIRNLLNFLTQMLTNMCIVAYNELH